MGTVFKILLFLFIIYFLYTWLKNVIAPSRKKSESQRDVRIFKKGEIEKPRLDVQDAETVDFEEIEETRPKDTDGL